MGAMSAAPDVIASRLRAARKRVADLARAAGRAPDSIRLVAVSKNQFGEYLAAAIAAGQIDFGESTVQEALPKIDRLGDPRLVWHFIGHLQSNKAKFIPGAFQWLHSLDSLALATRLERFAADHAVTLNALIEVNVSRDARKHGVFPEALDRLIEALLEANLSRLALRGLMTIGPAGANRDAIRACFAELRALRDRYREGFGLPLFTELSMGMSADYAEAIAEGATLIRLGTAIFGERVYK